MASQILGPSRPTPAPTPGPDLEPVAPDPPVPDAGPAPASANPGQGHEHEHDVLGISEPTPDTFAPLSSQDDLGPDGAAAGSCYDDIGLVLSRSIAEFGAGPNLEGPSGPRAGGPVPAPAHTSEIFRSVVAAGPDAGGPGPGPETGPASLDLDAAAASDAPVEGPGASPDHAAAGPAPEPSFPWGQLFLLSYSTAITFAVMWALWTAGWPRPEPAPNEANAPALSDRAAPPTPPHTAATAAAPMPAPVVPPENTAGLGSALQLGDLSIVPTVIEAARLTLVHSLQTDGLRYENDCLILHLKITNTSSDYTFAPIDKALVREHGMRAHDPYIALDNGDALELFPLAVDSEWNIDGQGFDPLAPGESREFLIAAGPSSARRLTDEMTWRVRLRTGVYRTDMLAVPFTRHEIQEVENPPEALGPDEDGPGTGMDMGPK